VFSRTASLRFAASLQKVSVRSTACMRGERSSDHARACIPLMAVVSMLVESMTSSMKAHWGWSGQILNLVWMERLVRLILLHRLRA